MGARILKDRPLTAAEYCRRYREKHPGRSSKSTMAWAKRNPGKVRATNNRHRKLNAEKRREAVWRANGIPFPTRPRPAVCELCGGVNANGKALSLDHCHKKSIFRGWLCNKCNTGLGKLGDSIEGLEAALHYLRVAYAG